MSSNAVDAASKFHILQLVDDCFFEVFKHLSVIDWCALRDTCTRLRQIADYCYEKDTRTFQFNGEYLLKERFSELTLDNARTFIRSFGHIQPDVVLHADAFAPDQKQFDDLVPVMNTYWNTLKKLKIIKIDLNAETIEQAGRLFLDLERLVIDKCLDDNRTFATCLMHCRQLKELELIRLFNIEGNSLAQAFPNLESFSIKSCDNFNYEFIKEFIRKNPQLKKLKFIGCNFVTDQIFSQIADHIPNLESLSLRIVHIGQSINENLMQLLRLTKLTKLEMNCCLSGVNTFLNGLVANNKLESLHFSSLEINEENVQTLCNLKTLKVLKFTATSNLDKDVCTLLATNLPSLQELHILECASTTFDELQGFVEHSASLNKLVYLQQSEDPSLSKQQFLSLVESRKKRNNGHSLNIYLDSYDHRNINGQLMWEGFTGILHEHETLVRLMPIDDEEDRSTAFDYGCGNSQKLFRYHDLYDDVNNEFDDDYDDFDDLDDFENEDDLDDFTY